MTQHEVRQATKISRRWPIISGSVAIALAVVVGSIALIRGNLPFEADAEWMEEIVEHRNPVWEVPSLLMNYLGGGWFAYLLPVVIVIIFCVRKRFYTALFFGLSTALSAAVVQLLKGIYGRPRPEDILVVSDFGSFPSGHAANAATLVVCLGLIFARAWVWVVGVAYVVLMMLSRTYLGAHWVSDTVGGALVGLAVALIVWAPFARKLALESRR
ncbi:MAG: phosphoesterase PA-phosphatase [Microbacteriaceae bacterium]|nr:phosphoesterase PA-phosphatase [Microbacteriaceae bacterium]